MRRRGTAGGDEFLEAIEAHRHEFFRFILRNVWDSGVAEDVFSQAVLAAYEGRQRFTPGTNFRAWMYRILTNKCFVANRETIRGGAAIDSDAAWAAVPLPDAANVLEHPDAVLDQCGDEVFRAMRALSTAQRTCLLLRAVERFSYQEIAEILEIPVGTVMTHLARGRRKLREELVEYAHKQGVIRSFPRRTAVEGPTPDRMEEKGRSSL